MYLTLSHRGEKQKKGGQGGRKLVGRVTVYVTCNMGLQNPISSIYFVSLMLFVLLIYYNFYLELFDIFLVKVLCST